MVKQINTTLIMPTPVYLSPAEAAERYYSETGIRISKDTLIRRVNEKKLAAIRTETGRYLISMTSLVQKVDRALGIDR